MDVRIDPTDADGLRNLRSRFRASRRTPGRPCVFVRLAACDLRCAWCDTPYAFTGGRKMSVDEVVRGGRADSAAGWSRSPAASRCCSPRRTALMSRLLDAGYEVLLETGGHLPLDDVPDEVVAIVDVKCPGSGEAARMHWPNLDQLSPHDEVKFVIADRADFDYARDVVRALRPARARAAPCCSRPCMACCAPADLARWILDARAAGAAAASGAQVHLERQDDARRVMAAPVRAVVLLSGGLDSATAAALARREGWALYGLTVRYGQVQRRDRGGAPRRAALGFARHVEIDVDLAPSAARRSSATARFRTRRRIAQLDSS